MANQSDIDRMLARLLEAGLKQVSGKEITAKNADAYLLELGDIPSDLLDAACGMYIASGTWFPAPGQIRKEANKLKMTVLRVPSGAEAWAQVLGAIKHKEAVSCSYGSELRDLIGEEGYWHPLTKYDEHMSKCDMCQDGGIIEEYDHPAVEATVRLFGGRDALFTEYLAADRARFIDAYKEVLERETYLITMPDEVRGYLDTKTEGNQIEAGNKMKELSERMRK